MKNHITHIVKNTGEKLRKLFVDGLKNIYWSEKKQILSLPKFARAATSEDLQVIFETHFTETQEHVNRLEKVFKIIHEPAKTKKCPAMGGLLYESNEIIKSTEENSVVRDCGLIFASQKVEHYEIASYGTLRTIASILRYNQAAELLQTTLEEEIGVDNKLSDLADAYINMEVMIE